MVADFSCPSCGGFAALSGAAHPEIRVGDVTEQLRDRPNLGVARNEKRFSGILSALRVTKLLMPVNCTFAPKLSGLVACADV